MEARHEEYHHSINETAIKRTLYEDELARRAKAFNNRYPEGQRDKHKPHSQYQIDAQDHFELVRPAAAWVDGTER